jgi:hypothetical protein
MVGGMGVYQGPGDGTNDTLSSLIDPMSIMISMTDRCSIMIGVIIDDLLHIEPTSVMYSLNHAISGLAVADSSKSYTEIHNFTTRYIAQGSIYFPTHNCNSYHPIKGQHIHRGTYRSTHESEYNEIVINTDDRRTYTRPVYRAWQCMTEKPCPKASPATNFCC